MANQCKVLHSAFLGTTFMTLFSYLFSAITRDNTREPELLGKMVHRLQPKLGRRQSQATGWVIHYAVGVLFVEIYAQFWDRSVDANKKSGLVFGGLSGIAAILIWKFTLTIHPFRPAVNFKTFAINLFLAHLIFGLSSVIGYRPSEA